MDESIHSTSGFPRIMGGGWATKLRLAALGLTVLLGSILVIWVNRTTWQRLNHLQREFSELKAESFYLGVRMRGDIQRLNDTLLRYRLRGDVADSESFYKEAQNFKEWLNTSNTNAITSLERRLFEEVGIAYEDYLTECVDVLEASRGKLESAQARDFKSSYEKVQKQSQYLLYLCDSFINNQRTAFDNFLKESNDALTTFQLLLKFSLLLLLVLVATLALLIYRGMIAPLRHQLTESHATIARQEKLASLGVLAAGVAHEVRNPLTAIKFRLFSLKKTLPAGSENEDVTVISNEISRLERIVRDFLQFARPSEPELVDVPARRIVQEVHDLLKPQLEKSAIELKLGLSEAGWVRADMHQLKQVLINLIQNSAESIGRDGVITLRVHNEAVLARKEDVPAVVLEVADNGKGIPPDVQKRLFDPFFTTKEGGTGLGLPIAERIVEKHGGELQYETDPHRGTTFSVVLPRIVEHGNHEI